MYQQPAQPTSAMIARGRLLFTRRPPWIAWALLTALVLDAEALVIHLLTGWPTQLTWIALPTAVPFVLGAIAARIPATSVRLSALLRGTVALAGLGLVVLVDLAIALLGVGRTPRAGERPLLAWAALGVAVAVLAYGPVRRALLARAGAVVYPDRGRPEALGQLVAGSLTRSIPLEDTLGYIAERSRAALELGQVAIWVERGGRLERVACHPPACSTSIAIAQGALAGLADRRTRGPAWIGTWAPDLLSAGSNADARLVPIADGGEVLGAVVAGWGAPDLPVTGTDERTLTELAAQLAPAVRNARLDSALATSLAALRRQARDLRASRARVVSAADDERRRLERNLHDGAQQHLIGLAFNLRAASALVRSDPGQAEELLKHLEEASEAALIELRALCQGVYPAVLESSGVGAALEAAAARLPRRVRVQARLADRYDPDLEAAAYFVGLEAIQNSAKHAGPDAAVTVTLEERDGALVLKATDDGDGFDTRSVREDGGLASIRDRIGAVGGTVQISSVVGSGTTIIAVLPLGTV